LLENSELRREVLELESNIKYLIILLGTSVVDPDPYPD